MKLTLFGMVAILGVVAIVVLLVSSRWDRPVEDN